METLTQDILIHFLKYITIPDIGRFGCSSKVLSQLSVCSEEFWKKVSRLRGYTNPNHPNHASWKACFLFHFPRAKDFSRIRTDYDCNCTVSRLKGTQKYFHEY